MYFLGTFFYIKYIILLTRYVLRRILKSVEEKLTLFWKEFIIMTKNKEIVAYPAVLDDSENMKGMYTVTFPDVPGAISQGTGVAQAMANGSEALGLMLYDVDKLPHVSDLKQVQGDYPNALVTMVFSDLDETRKKVKKPTVKKNTTIPGDLAAKAEEAGINFSKTLTEALEAKLN